jgi:hypothetical protein
MEHLARFRLVRDLANNVLEDPFRESFDVHIVHHEKPFRPECLVEMEHDDRLELIVENKGDKELYLYVYNLGSCWQIENILRGSYDVIPAKQNDRAFTGLLTKKLKMMVPPEMRDKGHRQCKDLIKVFVTSQPTSFDLLELPKLGEPVNKNTTSRTGRDGGSHSSEDWATVNFPICTSLK